MGDAGVDPETWKNDGFVGEVRVGDDAVLFRLLTTSLEVVLDVN